MTIRAVPRFVVVCLIVKFIVVDAVRVESGWATVATEQFTTLVAHLTAVTIEATRPLFMSDVLGADDTILAFLLHARWDTAITVVADWAFDAIDSFLRLKVLERGGAKVGWAFEARIILSRLGKRKVCDAVPMVILTYRPKAHVNHRLFLSQT